MMPEAFIVWLQGYLSACGNVLTAEQVAVLQAEMAKVPLRGMFRPTLAV